MTPTSIPWYSQGFDRSGSGAADVEEALEAR